MRAFICIIVLIGGPFYLWDMVTKGPFDAGAAALMLGLMLLALLGLWTAWRKIQVTKGREDFYLSQRKK